MIAMHATGNAIKPTTNAITMHICSSPFLATQIRDRVSKSSKTIGSYDRMVDIYEPIIIRRGQTFTAAVQPSGEPT
jgi:hypothetical protein